MRKQIPRGPLDTLFTYCCRKRFWGVSKSPLSSGLFENLEKILSPGGTLRRAEPEGGPIVFTLDFIGVDYHTGIFKITTFRWHF